MGFEWRQITHFQKPAKTVSAAWWPAIMDGNHTASMTCFGDKEIAGWRGECIVVTKASKKKIREGCNAARRGIRRVGCHDAGGVAAGRCRDAGRHGHRDQNRSDHAL